MSFYSDITNNPRLVELQHLPKNVTEEVHKHGADNFPLNQQLRMVPLSRFNNIRVKPMTQLQSVLFTNGNQTDYYINAGYTEKIWFELELNIINAAVTLNVEWLIDRIEIISNHGHIISTIRDHNLYHSWLFKTYDETQRIAPSYNKNGSLVAQSLAVGAHTIYIPIWSFIDSCEPKLNAIKNQLLFRVYWSSNGVVAGLNTNATVVLADIICQTQQLSNMGESLETQRKQAKMLLYRIVNPIRASSETIAMNASSTYNFRLTSLNSMSAFLVFHISLVGAAPDAFTRADAYELLDENNVIVGLKTTHEQSRLVSLSFPGYLATLSSNIYVIPFSFPTLAIQGIQSGFYKMTTKEQIRIYTDAAWVNGNYTFNCYSYDYNTLHIEKGIASVSK